MSDIKPQGDATPTPFSLERLYDQWQTLDLTNLSYHQGLGTEEARRDWIKRAEFQRTDRLEWLTKQMQLRDRRKRDEGSG